MNKWGGSGVGRPAAGVLVLVSVGDDQAIVVMRPFLQLGVAAAGGVRAACIRRCRRWVLKISLAPPL